MRTTPNKAEAEPAQLAYAEPGILVLPTELRLRGHAELAAYFGDLRARFDLAKDVDDRFLTEYFARHLGWIFDDHPPAKTNSTLV